MLGQRSPWRRAAVGVVALLATVGAGASAGHAATVEETASGAAEGDPLDVPVPGVTVPPVTSPPLTLFPGVSTPPVTTPPVSLPVVELPPLSVPSFEVPPVTLPPVTLPGLLPGTRGTGAAATTAPTATSAATPAPAAASAPRAGAELGAGGGGEPVAATPAVEAAVEATTIAEVSSAPLAVRLRQAAADTVQELSFPLGLALAIVAFLVVQHRVDRGDPRMASIGALPEDDLLEFS